MRALERANDHLKRVPVSASPQLGIADAPHLKPTTWFKSSPVDKVSTGTVQPLEHRIALCTNDPVLVPTKFTRWVPLLLEQKCDTPSCLDECAQAIAKRLRFVVPVSHFMPPMMNLEKSIARGR
jgi:hypothetical protein